MGDHRFKALALAAGAATVLVLPTGVADAAPAPDCPPATAGGQYPGSGCGLAVSDSKVTPGESITVSGDGFASGTPYTITLHSTPQVLATGTASSSTITRTVTIPTNTSYGNHTLVLDGTDATGGPRELRASIVVAASSNGGGGGGNGGGNGNGNGNGGGGNGGSNGSGGNGSNSGANRAGVSSAADTAQAGTGLPSTGASANTLPLAAGGAGLVIVGAGFVAYSRRRRSSHHAS